MMKEISAYSYVRALAVLLVILGHCVGSTVTDYGGIEFVTAETPMSRLLSFVTAVLYAFHMPLFMALSGCLFRLTIDRRGLMPFRPFVKGKLSRLIVPFVFVSLLWTIPIKFFCGYWQGTPEVVAKQIFEGQILMLGNSHLWFLQALFLIFVAAWVIERCRLRRRAVVFMMALLVVSVIGTRMFPGFENGLFSIKKAMFHLFWFYCGFYFEGYRERINRTIDRQMGWGTAMTACLLIPVVVYVRGVLPQAMGLGYLTTYLTAAYCMLATYAVCYKATRITPPSGRMPSAGSATGAMVSICSPAPWVPSSRLSSSVIPFSIVMRATSSRCSSICSGSRPRSAWRGW